MLKRLMILLATIWIALSGVPLHAGDAPALIARTPYVFPYTTRDQWLDELRKRPAAAEAVTAYAGLFGAEDYARYAAGTRTIASRIRYRVDGLAINGLVVMPKGKGPFPVLIYNHGGVAEWGRIILPEILEFHRLAERGYIVLASAFRGEGGSEGAPDMGGGDVADSLALVALARSMPEADARRIGLWGFSRGGNTAYRMLAQSTAFAAAVIVGGPADLVTAPRRAEFDRHVYPQAIRDYARDKDGALARLSPLGWPERLAPRTALLLLHGGDDVRVPPEDSLRMASALQRLKRAYRLKLYEGGTHDLLADQADVRREIDRWFDLYVRDARPAPANGASALAIKE